MRSVMFLALSLTALSGCIIYDNDGGGGCEWDDGTCPDPFGGGNGDPTEDSAVEDSGTVEDAVVLSLNPAQAEQGEIFLGSITVAEGELDLTLAKEIRVYGDAELLVWGARANEITATFEVRANAELGPVDLVVELEDGSAELLPAAFTVYAAGSGHESGDWADSDPGDDCE